MKQDEAQRLALGIETFWHARGYPHIRAIALLTRLANDNSKQIWGIRSNLTGREQCERIDVKSGRHRQAAQRPLQVRFNQPLAEGRVVSAAPLAACDVTT